MDTNATVEFKPPWFAFKTLLGFLHDLGAKPLPPQIDRSMMGTKSGTEQNNLLGALKGFGFIDNDQNVEPLLAQFVDGDEDERKAALRQLVQTRYPKQLKVSEQNGTEAMLQQSFTDAFGVGGETRRKAVTFFLQAAKYAGIPLSPNFPATRMGSGKSAPGARKPAKRTAKGGRRKKVVPAVTGTGSEETKTISFGDAGSVTVSVDVRWLELPVETFTALRSAIASLEALGEEPEDEEDEEDEDSLAGIDPEEDTEVDSS